jgi:colicin import membrane protein
MRSVALEWVIWFRLTNQTCIHLRPSMRSIQLFFIFLGLSIAGQSPAAPQNERVAFCEDQSQSKFPSRYEMQKAFNQCMENADKLIQAYEQDKVRRLEQERLAQEKREKERRFKSLQDNRDTKNDPNVNSPSESYSGRIRARIKPNISFSNVVEGNPTAEVEVRCSEDGTIISRRLVTSSGNTEWDNAVLRAIDKTEILPRDVNGKVPSPLLIKFRPRE